MKWLLSIALALLVILAVASTSTSFPPRTPQQIVVPDSLQRVDFRSGRFVPSIVCAGCHTDIYRAWRESVHSQSYRDPLFQNGLRQATELAGVGITRICLTCHAPAQMLVEPKPRNDVRLEEGIGCEVCHALTGANFEQFPYLRLDHGATKYGTKTAAEAESLVHDSAYSEFVGSPEYCAACHEYQGRAGAPLLTTLSEYGEGPYEREYVVCRDCHMPLVPGRNVAEHVRPRTEQDLDFIGYHGILGGRSLAQLRRAVNVELVNVERGSGSVAVTVELTNRAAGHWLPTGMPTRRLVIEISTSWEGQTRSRRVEFGRSVVNANNERLFHVARMMLEGARVIDDTRLRPRQTRTIRETLQAPQGVATELLIRCFYETTEDPNASTDDIVRIERTL